MTTRDLLGTNLLIKSSPEKAFNLDTILLSDFTRVPKNTKLIYDFGCGNGSIMLYLSQKTTVDIMGIEIQKHRFLQAKENILINKLSSRLKVINEDINLFRGDKADLIVSNPPYFKVNNKTKQSIDPDMLIAKHEVLLNLESLIVAVRNNINHGGLFFMIHQASRLDEITILLNKYDFSLKRIRFVHPFINKIPNQVLIEAKFKGKPFLNVMPPLIQYDKREVLSKEMNLIYKGRSYHENSK